MNISFSQTTFGFETASVTDKNLTETVDGTTITFPTSNNDETYLNANRLERGSNKIAIETGANQSNLVTVILANSLTLIHLEQ